MLRQMRTRERLRGFAGDGTGVAAIEFALVLPILMLLVLGCYEVPNFVMLYQKIERTSSGVADLVAQADEPMTKNQMEDIFKAAKIMMSPFDIATKGEIIVSSINTPNGAGTKITWQQQFGSIGKTSNVGASNGAPTLPAGLTPASNEEVIATEVWYKYTPLLGTIIYKGSTLYRANYTRPRNHNLMTCPAYSAC